ncbi:hypothetical protein [Nocardioides campestrisoli]|uniref:hypothetical protein n=1 Tax=Nocardioides campestrisoli TaxID=2736757 RepID=UPI0015E6E99C|nr:hypothetical protein [Nocardioides campestrisoli]
MSPAVPSTAVLESLADRTASTARRLLAGAGSASLTAYRDHPDGALPVLAHGVSGDGELVVALASAGISLSATGTDVRLDVRVEAPQALVRIVAASIHLLGRVSWLDGAALDPQTLPEPVALVAADPAVRVGLVHSDRVLVHDAAGVTPYALDDVALPAPSFPSPGERLEAAEAIAGLPAEQLAALCDAVAERRLPGRVLSDRPTPVTSRHALGGTFCVDVDALGVNLMRVRPGGTSVLFLPFPEPVADVAGVRRQLTMLSAGAAQDAS